jgi:hypothetical protein
MTLETVELDTRECVATRAELLAVRAFHCVNRNMFAVLGVGMTGNALGETSVDGANSLMDGKITILLEQNHVIIAHPLGFTDALTA